MPDIQPKHVWLSDLSSVLFLGVALAVAAVVFGVLLRDYFVTKKRAKRFYQKRKPANPTDQPTEPRRD
jgi:hypothetical protein